MDKPAEKVQIAKSAEKESKGDLSKRDLFTPFFFSLTPREFFNHSPFELMKKFTEEMDRNFKDFGFWRGFDSTEKGVWAPAIEVFQKDGNFFVRAELPGLNVEEVKVEVTDEGLIIKGERKHETKEEKKDFYRSEVSYGSFYRLVPLPEGAMIDKIKATFDKGILEVVAPVPMKETKRREVPIGEAVKEVKPAAATSGGKV
jgi:HSP20 family protein